MRYQTLQVTQTSSTLFLTIQRPTERNSINKQLLVEFHHALDSAEQDAKNQIIVIQGNAQHFCIGMELHTVNSGDESFDSKAYMHLLQRFASIPRIVIAKVEGTVIAGGIGIVAASDLVIATPQSQYSLSEALWGLLPCCVVPYLIRRIGFQAAYRLTLTTQSISAEEAYRIQLIDELTQQPDEQLQKKVMRLSQLDSQTLADLKKYFHKMWIITAEMEQTAIAEITRLMQDPRIQTNLKNYKEEGLFPWENKLGNTVYG